MPDIYDPVFVQQLFDEMSSTYEAVNYLSSFGFSHRWRRQFVEKAALQPGMAVCDLMCGMGECWGAITRQLGSAGRILAQNLSSGMLRGARSKKARLSDFQIDLSQQNALASSLGNKSVDAVICGFGVKTLPPDHFRLLAAEIMRILKPGGAFSLIDVSVPAGWILEKPYLFYLENFVPFIGRLLLGNPENSHMLGEYTTRFGNCHALWEVFSQIGFVCTYERYFWGCATGVCGYKPLADRKPRPPEDK